MRAGLAAMAAVMFSATASIAAEDCHVGAYRFADGAVVDIAPTDGGLRWRTFDGATGALKPKGGGWASTLGWTERADGHAVELPDCARGEIAFDGKTARRIAFDVTEAAFAGRGGVKLAGRLVLPKGSGPVPIVVLVHGSEDSSALRFHATQRLFPARGVGVTREAGR